MAGSRQRRWSAALAALCALFLVAQAPSRAAPVLVIGLDGLERRVVEAMWAEGYLPNLKALADRGAMLDLATAEHSRERPVWTTVATGRSSADHGIVDNNVDGAGAKARGAGSGEREVQALWNVAHTHGLFSHVADWPATFPAESIAGVILSDRAAVKTDALAATPPKVAASLERWRRMADALYGDLFPGGRDGAASDRLSAWATEQALRAGETDLLMVRLRRVDRTSHRLWKYFEPESYASARELGWEYEAREFYESYVAVDAAVGRLLASLPQEGHVVVLSAHGFKGIPESTALKCSLAPVLESLGHLAVFAGEPEWRQTRLYVVDSAASDPRKQVRVNLKGRESKGRVKASEREALLAQLEQELAEFQYAGTQTPTFRVEAPRDGEPGDLVVVFNEIGVGTVLERGDERLDGAMITFDRRSGSHGRDTPGVLFAAGPGITPGTRSTGASVLDVGPLILRLLDVPLSDELIGQVPQGLLTLQWDTAHPGSTVPSYEP